MMQEAEEVFAKNIHAYLSFPIDNRLNHSLKELFAEYEDLKLQIKIDLSPYIMRAEEMSKSILNLRTDFYNISIRVLELIKFLPNYQYNPVEEEKKRDNLYFDPNFGEKNKR